MSLALGSEFVTALPTISLDDLPQDEHDQECPLCKTAYNSDGTSEDPVILPCRHIFGRYCLNAWLAEHGKNTCPGCRSILFDLPYVDDDLDFLLDNLAPWPRDDDNTEEWMSDFIHFNFITSDLDLYTELYNAHRVEEEPEPGAIKLNQRQEVALLRLLTGRTARTTPMWRDRSDTEWLETMREENWEWATNPGAWLLYWAFPRYDPNWWFRDFWEEI